MKFYDTATTTKCLINNIITKTPNIYLRFGDGDFNLMQGHTDMLALPSNEMQLAYKKTFSILNNTNFISINFHCQKYDTVEDGMCPGVHANSNSIIDVFIDKLQQLVPNVTELYSAVALHHVLSMKPDLYIEFLNTIKQNNSTIIIGNRHFNKDELKLYFGENKFIGGNSSNSFNDRDRISAEFNNILKDINNFTVCILALGCGGRAMFHKLFESTKEQNKQILFIDIGSSIDILMGQNTRAWIEMTKPNISYIRQNVNKNTIIKSLTELGLIYGTDKTTYHNYTDFYDNILHNYRNKIIKMIEFGIASGSSLRMWHDYFPNALIYSYDINLAGNPNLSNVICKYTDQNSCDSLQTAMNDLELESIDFIIEDGGHFSNQQRNSLNISWKYLKKGGIYIIEDLHTNVKHWYPQIPHWAKTHYWNENPTLFEGIQKLQLGIASYPHDVPINPDDVKQIILWSQPHTTSMTCVLIKK